MEITTKEYTEKDKEALIKSIEALQSYIVAIDPLKRQATTPGYANTYTDKLLKAISKKNGKIYFAECGGKIAGFIAGTMQPQAPGGTLQVVPSNPSWIRELYVSEEFRGKGVGTMLMKTIEEHFKSKGCDTTLVGVFAPNSDSHNFYESKGYSDLDITMIKKL